MPRFMIAGALLIASAFACGGAAKGADTPLQRAAWDGNVEQVKALLAAGTKVDDETYGVRPPLYLTIVQGQQRNTEVAKLLLAAGVDPNVEVDDGYPGGRRVVLQTALGWGNIEIMKALLAAGAKVDHVDKSGQQPIHQRCPKLEKNVHSGQASHFNKTSHPSRASFEIYTLGIQ